MVCIKFGDHYTIRQATKFKDHQILWLYGMCRWYPIYEILSQKLPYLGKCCKAQKF